MPLCFASSRLTIVALGDSTTSGAPAYHSPAELPPDGGGNPESQYGYWIMKKHPEWNIVNRGVSGERTDEIARRFVSDVLPYKPDALILMAGVNDLYQGVSVNIIKSNLHQLALRAKKEKIRLLLCTILPYDRATPKAAAGMAEVNAWLRGYAKEMGFGFCDTFHAAENPARPGHLLGTPDGLHPDIATYKKVGEALSAALEVWLGGEGSKKEK